MQTCHCLQTSHVTTASLAVLRGTFLGREDAYQYAGANAAVDGGRFESYRV